MKFYKFFTFCIALLGFFLTYFGTIPLAYAAFFSVGSGFIDTIPRQIVRTNTDKVYVFASNAQFSSIIKAYWTAASGIPSATNNFSGNISIDVGAQVISVDAVYDGKQTIYVLCNLQNGQLKAIPFNITTNTFASTIVIGTGNPVLSGDYIGSQGVSGLFDSAGKLHLAYWSAGNHITYKKYIAGTTNTLTAEINGIQIDDSGNANHPVLAISPKDQSITIAWVSQATSPAKILAKSSPDGTNWSSVQQVNTSGNPWVSDYFGKNIDQGPSLIITSDGKKHLLYMEGYDTTNDYGHMHYATTTSTTWNGQKTNFYSHAAALATNSLGEIYIFGHGHPNNGSNCNSLTKYVCSVKINTNGTWQTPQIIATAPVGEDFDGSSSTKWSVVGWNRPELIELVFYEFSQKKIYYTFLSGSQLTALPTATLQPASSTPVSTVAPTTSSKPGDANGDGKVDINDLITICKNYLLDPILQTDQNGDKKINTLDFARIVAYLSIATATPTITPTPRPTSVITVQPTTVASLFPTSLPTAGGWTQDAHDAQRTGYTPEQPLEPWTYLWSWNGADSNGGTGNHTYNAPNEARTVTGGGNLYVPAGDKGLFALNLQTGNKIWNFVPDGNQFKATPVYGNGTVYIGGTSGNVYKLQATTGQLTGTYGANSPVHKTLLFASGYIFAVSNDGVLHKINPDTMQAVWKYTAASTAATPPSYSATRDMIIYGTNDLYVHAVTNTDGSRKWRIKPTQNPPGDPAHPGEKTDGQSMIGTQFDRGYPVIAERSGTVLLRLQLPHDALYQGPNNGLFANTNAENRAWLNQNPQYKNLFALNLDTGEETFIPAVGYGSTEDFVSSRNAPNGVMGTIPVLKLLSTGKEVAYVPFRNGQTNPPTFYNWSGHMGEMVLDNSTVPTLLAGDLRFVKMNSYSTYGGNSPTHINDEENPLTMAGNTLFYAHWAASSAVTITDRSDTLGLQYANPIQTKNHPPVMRAIKSIPCKNVTTRWTDNCTNLSYVTDGGRYYNGPGWWQYFDVADPPGWRYAINTMNTGAGTAYSAGSLPRYTYVSNGYIIVEGNGGDIMVFKHSGTPVQ